MKIPTLDPAWPESWQEAYHYDLEEFSGRPVNPQYQAAYQARYQTTLRLVGSALGGRGTILDVAAAQGNFSLALAERGYDVTWNDLRNDLVGYVQLKYERGQLSFAPGNVLDLKLEGEFDLVLATEVIEHVAHPDDFLAKLVSLAKPDGHIVITTPNGACFGNKLPKFSDCPDPSVFESNQFQPNSDGHIFLLHPEEIEGFAQRSGLRIREMIFFSSILLAGRHKTWFLHRILSRAALIEVDKLLLAIAGPLCRKVTVQTAVWLSKQ
jgi:2-polyprenyl-3-methyl-5-hydroxy-6-metoxy-1,4-benzoquinol methylase